MSVVVTVILVGGMVSLCVGLVTALVPLLSRDLSHNPIIDEPVYWNFTVWTIVLGIVLMCAPQSWYGPSWSYFASMIPHNGFGMGLCLTLLSVVQAVALLREAERMISVMLFLNGFVYWTSGLTLGAEGLLGHQGLMEAPFILYVGAHAFALSAARKVRQKVQP
jgi:hypothetical protein